MYLVFNIAFVSSGLFTILLECSYTPLRCSPSVFSLYRCGAQHYARARLIFILLDIFFTYISNAIPKVPYTSSSDVWMFQYDFFFLFFSFLFVVCLFCFLLLICLFCLVLIGTAFLFVTLAVQELTL